MDILQRKRFLSDRGFPLRIWRTHAQPYCPMHQHEFMELVIIFGGRGIHFTEGGEFSLVGGDVFVIHAHQAHGYKETCDLALRNILFIPDRLKMPMHQIHSLPGYHALFTLEPKLRGGQFPQNRLRLSREDLTHIEAWMDRLEIELDAKQPGYKFVATALLMEIIAYISRRYANNQAPASHTLLRLGEVISHLENHYEKKITLEELAEIGHVSVNNLLRMFGASLGCSPIEYLIKLRITNATELLRSEPLSISEVAAKVGFADSNYFTRQFHKIMGLSPSAFRRQFPAWFNLHRVSAR